MTNPSNRNWHNQAAKLTAMERRMRALDMRTRGMTFEQIGEALGCTRQAAHNAYTKGLDTRLSEYGETQDRARALELAKLDNLEREANKVLLRRHLVLYQGAVVSVTDPADPDRRKQVELIDDGPVVQAINCLVRVSERRARLLGIDAPEVVALDGEVTLRVVRIHDG